MSLNGPRASINGWGNNIPISNPGIAPVQELVDIDSIMSNRNVKTTKAKRGMVNDVDISKFKTYESKLCDKGLDPLSSILTYPKQLYKEISINRFYDLNINPQLNIYWNNSINSQLEAKDNYDHPYPYSMDQIDTLPKTINGDARPCKVVCDSNCNTNVYNNKNLDSNINDIYDTLDNNINDYYDNNSDSDNEYM